MKLPNLNDMDVSKKMLMAISGAYFVKDIEEFSMAAIVASLIGIGIICQTVIDVMHERIKTPSRDPAEPEIPDKE